MLDLLRNIYFAADAWTGNIQNEMDASYVEQSSLTNLFTEQKFLGWAGLLLIFVAIREYFIFNFKHGNKKIKNKNKNNALSLRPLTNTRWIYLINSSNLFPAPVLTSFKLMF